uniref:DNA-directed RNA polymerase subunit beta n=1 Tax=Lachancea kluyveri TaxID=4934 RepID=Q04387_LACKL|nr:unnamed protein product [Lachancea kluyveri]prf//1712308F ORF 6 [Lachancea kluyveri]
MEYTDYGQIKIYETLFEDLDVSTIKNTPIECIEMKLSYCGIYNNRELPIMVGSKFDLHDNILGIKGYFIIDGICKSVNNIKMTERISFSKDRAYLTDNSKIEIKDMFNYVIKKDNKSRKWSLPINWRDIIKYSSNKKELEDHLSLIYTKSDKVIKNEIDLMIICYMFECWLGIKKESVHPWRLITPGELIYDIINKGEDVVKCFRTNTWKVKYINNVNSVSEDMKHYNIVGDIESIRRITIPTQRENTNMENRMVKLEDKYKICPVQTSDGALCGTVYYLCKDSKVTNTPQKVIEKEEGNYHTFLNSVYIGKTSIEYINKHKDNGDIHKINDIYYIFNRYGRVIKSNSIVSYTASLIPYRKNNPPIRSMFSCSMMKQAISGENIYSKNLLNTKSLIFGGLGHDIVVAIMPWYGYNIEDAIVINKKTASKFRSRKCRIYRENNCKIIGIYVKKNQYIIKGQLLYKTYNPELVKTIEFIYSDQDGTIDELKHSEKYIKLVIIKERDLEVGDKMTSRHGQKGVVSLILNNNEMPYYYEKNMKKEIDLLINPHAFPSRMTMGQIKEMGNNEKEVYVNNKKLDNKILVGRCFYMALRHQVDDKIQYRNSGNIDIINKQPVSGKKNNGGLRFGQMERDILIGLGAWNTLKELWSIDKTNIYVCPKSGKINPKCCKIKRESHQYFKICLSYMRALGHDILIKNNKYSIIEFDPSDLKKTTTLKFGDLDPLDIRIYRKIVVLPLCLRSTYLNKLYTKHLDNTKEIEKEIKKLLKSKKGAYHKLVEGHRVDHCIRSVIVPDPTLDIYTVKIPLGANISTSYGILNRQPSLNVDSMKIVKLIQGKNKTISFNPLLCKSFNADFDGDEMNIYGIKNEESIQELKQKLIVKEDKTQDYILGKEIINKGLTANRQGIKLMIEKGSKGKEFNYTHMFEKIGQVTINENIKTYIDQPYNGEIKDDDWYILSMAARQSAASIGVNTPITGYLESVCNQMYI